MKINEYEVDGSVIRYNTDLGVFAYPADKFSSLEELEKEISKKLSWRAKKLLKNKKIKILKDLEDKDVKEKELI